MQLAFDTVLFITDIWRINCMNTSLEIGQIVNTHGLRGEVKVMPWCDDPAVFDELAYVCIDNKEFDIEEEYGYSQAEGH